jgi:hypothetical protein
VRPWRRLRRRKKESRRSEILERPGMVFLQALRNLIFSIDNNKKSRKAERILERWILINLFVFLRNSLMLGTE